MRFFWHNCYLLGVVICLSTQLSAQPIQTRLDSLSKCPDSLAVAVYIDDFYGVASMSLKFDYDTISLQYKGYKNLNPEFAGNFLMNGYNGQVIMSWFSLNPVNIASGLLVEIRFLYKNNTDVILDWEDPASGSCVYTDLDGNELPAIFYNGYVHGLMHTPQNLFPADHATGVTTNPTLHWTGSGCSSLYFVELSEDSIFSNPIISNSSVFGTFLPVNGLTPDQTYYWRLQAYNDSFTTQWSTFTRFKTTSLSIEDNLLTGKHELFIMPNPALTYTTISFEGTSGQLYTLKLYNSQGILIHKQEIAALSNPRSNVNLNTDKLPPGVYLIILDSQEYQQEKFKQGRLVVVGTQ